MSPSPSLALFPSLLFFTRLLYSVHTDSIGDSTSTYRSYRYLQLLLTPGVSGNPITIDDPLNTTIESYITDERPTYLTATCPPSTHSSMQHATKAGWKGQRYDCRVIQAA